MTDRPPASGEPPDWTEPQHPGYGASEDGATPPALDVERLALALHGERLDRFGSPCGNVTEAYDDHMSFHRTRAERIAAEYHRATEGDDR